MTWVPHPTSEDALRAAGVAIDPEGTAILWHATDSTSADGIESSGVMTGEDGQIWFSTSKVIAPMQHSQGRAADTLMEIRVAVADLHQEMGFDQDDAGAEITHFTALYNEDAGYRPARVEARHAWSQPSSSMPEGWDI